MKKGDKLLLGIFIIVSVFLCFPSNICFAQGSFGAILVAHGARNPDNNQDILTIHKNVTRKASCPVEVAFLGYTNGQTVDNAIKKLLGKGITQILLVHVAPSSYGYNEQIKTFVEASAAGLRKANARPTIKIVAMDDHPLAVDMLSGCARTLSKTPAEESLLLVGGGPIDELENISSLMDLETIGQTIQNERGFREVVCTNIRTHSPDVIFVRSINELQKAAKRLMAQGRVIVVPYVLQKDFYMELESYLQGIIPPEDISREEILAHANVEKWVSEVIAQGIKQPQLKQVNRNWSVMKDEKGGAKNVQKYGFTGN